MPLREEVEVLFIKAALKPLVELEQKLKPKEKQPEKEPTEETKKDTSTEITIFDDQEESA